MEPFIITDSLHCAYLNIIKHVTTFIADKPLTTIPAFGHAHETCGRVKTSSVGS